MFTLSRAIFIAPYKYSTRIPCIKRLGVHSCSSSSKTRSLLFSFYYFYHFIPGNSNRSYVALARVMRGRNRCPVVEKDARKGYTDTIRLGTVPSTRSFLLITIYLSIYLLRTVPSDNMCSAIIIIILFINVFVYYYLQ